ncbi:MAG: CapA family protein [Candidatus Pacebacteria bacterium]|nr:CapA family protein [Candidatus Paceibacterota bacterium]
MTPQRNSKIKWVVGMLFVLSPIFITIVFSEKKHETIQLSASANFTESFIDAREKPKYNYLNKDFGNNLVVSADAYLVGDLNTGEIILSKNAKDVYPIASVSKLMTALVSTEIANPNDIAKASAEALKTYGTNGNFKNGEKIKTDELLYPLLLESSNDAAEILAEHFDRDSFIRKMNQEAEKLNMEKTSYEDPSGLSPNNTSTSLDLFKLAGYLVKEKTDLLKITTKRNFVSKAHNWSSTNQFLREPGYIGGKSGYTDKALETVISMFSLPLGENTERPVAIVLLKSKDRYQDVKNILNYLKKNVYYGGKEDANTDWVRAKTDMPDIRDPDFITMNFTGDIMLDRGVENSVIKNFNNDFGALFENLEILKKADISFANLEGPVSDIGRDRHNLYSFRMNPTVIPTLAGAGFDIVSVANNHVGDWGRDAYADTLSRLQENEILYTGGGVNAKSAEEPTVIEKYGIKIGFLGFSDVGPDWMKATDEPAQAGLLLASNPRFDEIVKNASAKVDYLVVSFHWGDEYKVIHNARQEFLAHKAVDAGAKLVIGHHPHVMEDTEVYKNSFIAYSLGNFIFDQGFSQNTMQGMLLQIKLGRDGSMTTQKNIVKLNSVFQPEKIIEGREEEIKFQ